MTSRIWKALKSGLAILLLSFYMGSTALAARADVAPRGNNGTLKVHELGTASGTESNDPKVCAFNFEGFNFDPADSGYITMAPQGGSLPVGVAAGPFNFGPTDAIGYAQTSYFNIAGGTTIANGTYKATLFGKDTGNNIDLTDEKAKSKVFKVECAAPVEVPVILTNVTPAAVTFNDVCITAQDTYTIPATTGVTYQIAGSPVVAGAYPGTGTVTVTAVANAGFSLIGTTSWQFTFTNLACSPVIIPVIAAASLSTDITCEDDGSFTIPATTGVAYRVNGVITAAGTYPVSDAASLVVTAEAVAGYSLSGQATWTLVFAEPDDCEIPEVDICPNINGLQTQIPAGMVTDRNGDCVTPGSGGGTLPSNTIITPSPQLLATSTVTQSQPAIPAASPATRQLVNTGSSMLMNLFAGMFLLASATALTIASNKRRIKVL